VLVQGHREYSDLRGEVADADRLDPVPVSQFHGGGEGALAVQ